MEKLQMLLPMEPQAFWQQMKEIVEQVVNESKLPTASKHTERPLIKEVQSVLNILVKSDSDPRGQDDSQSIEEEQKRRRKHKHRH